MTKNILATTGRFQLVCPLSGQMVRANRPSVVTDNSFFQDRRAIGQVEVVKADVDPTLTDAEWVAFLKKHGGDVKKAAAEVYTRAEAEAEDAEQAKKVSAPSKTTGK